MVSTQEDKFYEDYRSRVYEKLTDQERTILPPTWWETVIKHYYKTGYSEDRTVRAIQETMHRSS
jgi:hypothetical protein